MNKKGSTTEDFKNGVVIGDLSEIKEALEMYAQVSKVRISDYSKENSQRKAILFQGA